MTALDLAAFVAASLAGACLGLRGYMLKPACKGWVNAPGGVVFTLLALAAALGTGAVAILAGAHASAREAMIYGVLAQGSLLMLWDLLRQRA